MKESTYLANSYVVAISYSSLCLKKKRKLSQVQHQAVLDSPLFYLIPAILCSNLSFECKIIYPNYRLNSLARRNYIASNLQNSQVEVSFCTLRNTPVDLAKVYYYYLDSFPIYTITIKIKF